MKYQTKVQALSEDLQNEKLKTEFVSETDELKKSINRKIREKYSLSDELALLRKALAKLGVNDEQLSEYNEFVEKCKVEAREELDHNLSDK